MRIPTGFVVAVMTAASLSAGGGRAEEPSIPLCPGLTIVTAVKQSDGDYESIKTIEAVTDDEVWLRYSTERMVSDMFSIEPPKLERTTIQRTVRRVDLESAVLYLQQFSTLLPEMVPETTAIGTSAAVLNALKSNSETELGIFIAFAPPNRPPADRNVHPNVYSNQMIAPITRVGDEPVMIPVLVNDRPVELPARPWSVRSPTAGVPTSRAYTSALTAMTYAKSRSRFSWRSPAYWLAIRNGSLPSTATPTTWVATGSISTSRGAGLKPSKTRSSRATVSPLTG